MLDFSAKLGYNSRMNLVNNPTSCKKPLDFLGNIMYTTVNDKKTELGKLRVEKMKLDRFFSVFLDRYGDRLDSSNNQTAEWKLYRTKFDEYEQLESKIKYLQYQIANGRNV